MERKKPQLFRSREQKYCILFDFLHWTFVGVNFPMSHYHSYSLISSDMGICMPVHLNPNLDIHMLISFQVISFSFLLYCRTHTHYTSLFIRWIFFFVLMVIRLYYYFVIRPKSVTLNVFYVSLNKTDLFTELFQTFVKIDIKYPLNVKSFFFLPIGSV